MFIGLAVGGAPGRRFAPPELASPLGGAPNASQPAVWLCPRPLSLAAPLEPAFLRQQPAPGCNEQPAAKESHG